MKIYPIITILLSAVFAMTADARTHRYKGDGNEIWEKKKLKAGDEVVIRDGTYTDLKISVHGNGKSDKPIIVRPQTPGGVILKKSSWIRYWGSHIIVEGFDFSEVKYPMHNNKVRALIANRKAGSNSHRSDDMCKNCILQHIRIDNEHPEALDQNYKWVEIYGYENTIRHNYFGAKKSESRVLQIQIKHSKAEKRPIKHHIHSNYFASRNEGEALGNGGEALLIGESSMQKIETLCLVENNLFFDASISGEPEVISNKSSSTTFQYNTIRETSSSLTLRHGNNNTVQYNWFLQNQKPGSGGVRVIGKDNKVFNNYIDGAAGAKGEKRNRAYRTALGMPAGYTAEQDAIYPNGYQLSERNIFDNNTVVKSVQPVMLSAWYNRGKLDMTRPPKDTTFTDNLVFQLGYEPLDVPWVKKQSISVDFTPASKYETEYKPNKAEYAPSFTAISGNISDWKVSDLVKEGTIENSKSKLVSCTPFDNGDVLYEQYEGTGADLSLMSEPLSWTATYKSAKLGPSWLNSNWGSKAKKYRACNS